MVQEFLAEKEEQLEKVIRRKVANLKSFAVGITAGLLSGIGLFAATNWLLIKGGENVGAHLNLLGQYFIGYKVSLWGSIIGFFYAFLAGFVIAFSVARLYNFIVDLKHQD